MAETCREIDEEDRATVRAALQRILTALATAGDSVDNLPQAQKAAVFNDQELANNILTKAGEDSRLICRQKRKWVRTVLARNALPLPNVVVPRNNPRRRCVKTNAYKCPQRAETE